MEPTPPFFLYDGECGFCQKWMRWLARRVRDRIEFIPSQSVDNLPAFGLSDDDVRTASYWVDENGVAHRGNSSIAHALQQADGAWRLVGLALELPLVRVVAAAAYRVIARNRHRLPAPGGVRALDSDHAATNAHPSQAAEAEQDQPDDDDHRS